MPNWCMNTKEALRVAPTKTTGNASVFQLHSRYFQLHSRYQRQGHIQGPTPCYTAVLLLLLLLPLLAAAAAAIADTVGCR